MNKSLNDGQYRWHHNNILYTVPATCQFISAVSELWEKTIIFSFLHGSFLCLL